MKKGFFVIGLAAAVACGSSAGDMLGDAFDDMTDVPDAEAQSPGDGSTMQYVGNSTQTFSGDASWNDNGTQVREGRFDWYRACQADFGPGHRMCTADEIIFTTDVPPLDEGAIAWIDPLSETCGRISDTSNTTRRAAVDHRGSLVSAYCASSGNDTQNGELNQTSFRPIACCGPK